MSESYNDSYADPILRDYLPSLQKDMVLIVGSGHNAPLCRHWDKQNFNVIAVNNAWRVWDEYLPPAKRFDVCVMAGDMPAAFYPRDLREEEITISAVKTSVKPSDFGLNRENTKLSRQPFSYNSVVNYYGGFQKLGYSVVLNSSYWCLYHLKPKVIGYIGCDMVYDKNAQGHTAFYGIGEDFKKRNLSDPDKMIRDQFKGRPEGLTEIYQQFERYAYQNGVLEVVNFSDVEGSRLPFKKANFDDYINKTFDAQEEQSNDVNI